MVKIPPSVSAIQSALRKEKRRRAQEPTFADRFWTFLYNLGFTAMSIGEPVLIEVGKENKLQSVTIDIFAENEDARLYVSSEDPDLSWVASSERIRKHENLNVETAKKNVGYILLTEDRLDEKASKTYREKGIRLLDPSTFDYFIELAKLYKNLAYFQFLGFVFAGQPIKKFANQELEIPAIRCKYSSKDYCYLFGIQPYKLIPLSTIFHRKMNAGADVYENYQRLVKAKKIKEIKEFISKERGVFPTNIIISFDSKSDNHFKKQGNVDEIQFGLLNLPSQFQSVTVIDGQHRLFAYEGLPESKTDLIYVVAFHKMDPERQVQTFVNINEKQTKVSPSLMWDLYPSILDADKIKARVARVVKRLNLEPSSALYKAIQYDSAPYSSITSKVTLESICTTVKDENILLVLGGIFDKNEYTSDKDEWAFSIINEYFRAVRDLDSEHWDRKEKTRNLLRSNQGMGALIRLMKEVVTYIDNNHGFSRATPGAVVEEFSKLLAPLGKLVRSMKTAEEVKKFKRIGEGGKQQIFVDFVKVINQQIPDFGTKVIENLDSDKLKAILADLQTNDEHTKLEAKESFFADTRKLKEENLLAQKPDDAIIGIIKTVVAFTNTHGGQLIFGLEDKTWKPVGLDETDLKLKSSWEKLKTAISQKIGAEVVGLEKTPDVLRIQHQNRTFAVLEVSSLPKKRLEDKELAALKKDQHSYKRQNGDSVIIPANEISKYCDRILKEIEIESEDDADDE